MKKGTAGRPKTAGSNGEVLRVLIVDDHPVVREGVRRTIERQRDMVVQGEAASEGEALAILEEKPCDLAVVDISIEGRSGIELIGDMQAHKIDCPVLVLTVHDDVTYAKRALHAGARGYILKQDGPDTIVEAIRKIMAGEVYISDRMATKLLAQFVGPSGTVPADGAVSRLSNRELEVLEAVGRGQGTKEIARNLNLSVSTIETYKNNVKTKLDLRNASHLASYAVTWLSGQQI